ncbi:PDZ and LIM domain protein 7, partial [Calypte anna]
MESYKVMLNGPAPWGFRLQGGKDFSMPLSISRLTPGGKAAQAGVGVGDWVLYIDGESTSSMTHIEAQNRIRACGDRLCLTLSRALTNPPVTLGPARVCVFCLAQDSLPCSEPLKYNFAPSTALNKTARPFGSGSPPNPQPGLVTKPVTYAPPAPTCTPQHNGEEAPTSAGCPPGCMCLTAAPPAKSCHGALKLGIEGGMPVRGGGLREAWSGALASAPASQCAPSPGQPPQLVEPPSTPVYDPVKLRLIEDAEDWQPRTGTSQSRSFHKLARLTGTDGWMPMGLSGAQGSSGELGDAASPSRAAGKWGLPSNQEQCPRDLHVHAAPRTPAATPGPASRPPWAVDPSFAERYAPDKTSTVVSKHSQPATPTPMQNRSSIVQAAQQTPEGSGRTPLCYKCNKVIRGRYLVALGHYYHPEEFICCQCRKVLDEGGFFEEKGSIFCPKCYDTRYAPSCAKCKKKITGEVMHALKMTWHVQCFTCAACKTPIRNRAFYMEEGQPYCERDYEKMFGTKCRGCDFKIDAGDRFLEALGFSWHDTCFVCAICQTNLEGKTFYSKKDKPLCKSHAFS